MTRNEQPPINVNVLTHEATLQEVREGQLQMTLDYVERTTANVEGLHEDQSKLTDIDEDNERRLVAINGLLAEYAQLSSSLGDIGSEFSGLHAQREDLIARVLKLRESFLLSHSRLQQDYLDEDTTTTQLAEDEGHYRTSVQHHTSRLSEKHASLARVEDDTVDLSTRLQAADNEYGYGNTTSHYQGMWRTERTMHEAFEALEATKVRLTSSKDATRAELAAVDDTMQQFRELQDEARDLAACENNIQTRRTEIYRRMGALAAQLRSELPGGLRFKQEAQTDVAEIETSAPIVEVPEQRQNDTVEDSAQQADPVAEAQASEVSEPDAEEGYVEILLSRKAV